MQTHCRAQQCSSIVNWVMSTPPQWLWACVPYTLLWISYTLFVEIYLVPASYDTCRGVSKQRDNTRANIETKQGRESCDDKAQHYWVAVRKLIFWVLNSLSFFCLCLILVLLPFCHSYGIAVLLRNFKALPIVQIARPSRWNTNCSRPCARAGATITVVPQNPLAKPNLLPNPELGWALGFVELPPGPRVSAESAAHCPPCRQGGRGVSAVLARGTLPAVSAVSAGGRRPPCPPCRRGGGGPP